MVAEPFPAPLLDRAGFLTVRALRWMGWLLGAVLLVAAILTAIAVFLIRSPAGQSYVADRVIGALERSIDGTVEVDAVRTPSLLTGATLVGVRIRDVEGGDFFAADSLRAGYGVRSLLRGRVELRPVAIWSPRVVIERQPGDSLWNVERIFRLGDPGPIDPGPGSEGEGLRLLLLDVEVIDGALLVHSHPEEPTPESPAREEIFFQADGLHAHFPRVDVLDPAREGEEIEVGRLEMRARYARDADEDIHVDDVRGRLSRTDGSVVFRLDRLWLPGSEMTGSGELRWAGPEGVELEMSLQASLLALSDLRWLEPRLPDAVGAASIRASGPLTGGSWRIGDMDLRLQETRVRGEVGLELADGLRFVDTEIEAAPLDLRRIAPWLDRPLPLEGLVTGRMRVDGPPGALRIGGRLSLAPAEARALAATADVSGTLHLGEAFGVSGFSLSLDPLPFLLISQLAPGFSLPGVGSLELEAHGRLATGIRVQAEATHREGSVPDSRVSASGLVRGPLDRVHVDLSTLLDPLALEMVSLARPDLGLRGSAVGTLQLLGHLDGLAFETALETAGGDIRASGVLNVLDPASRYELQAMAEGLELSRLHTRLPTPTRVSGLLRIGGRGFDPSTAQASAVLQLGTSRVGFADVDTVRMHAHLEGGRVHVDTLHATSSLGWVEAGGHLPVELDRDDGAVVVDFEARDLSVFRPFLPGQAEAPADTLSDFERDVLRLQGLDPDTVDGGERPLAIGGSGGGRVVLEGSLARLRGSASIALADGELGDVRFTAARMDAHGDSLLADRRHVEAVLRVDSLEALERSFDALEARVDVAGREGTASVRVDRDPVEWYRVSGDFQLDSVGGAATLEELALHFGPQEWILDRSAGLRWNPQAVHVDGFRMIRTGVDPMRLEADGTLPLDGPGDFRLDVEGLNLARLADLLQLDLELEGALAVQATLAGSASEPTILARLRVDDFRAGEMAFTRLKGGVDYRARELETELFGWRGAQRVLTVAGSMGADFALQEVQERFPDAPIDFRLAVDSLPVGTLLGFLEDLEDPAGIVDGELQLAGTLRFPEPTGSIRLRSGAVTLPELGVRPTEIRADLTMSPDRMLTVDASARSRGTLGVRGTVLLDPVDDPTFDLVISTSNFQALERRDMAARMGGEVTLRGRYRRPAVGGRIRVEQGVLFLEEFARTVDVVDLSDPAFFDVVDTTFTLVRPQIAASQNPFLQNLRVDVELQVQRDTWLRSREMDVEIGGDLLVTYSRADREVILVGPLQAIRGNYTQFGRQFQVVEGTVDFVGTPGIDPNLNIQALNRVRRAAGEPLNITASLEGTLLNPRVSLTSDSQPPISESDLISYLIFGRPSYALASGETSVLQGAAGAGVSLGLGTLAGQLGSVVAQQFGVDYFAITQTGGNGITGTESGVAGAFAETQIEMGQYVLDDVFLAVMLRPLTGLGPRTQTPLPGVRLEWRFADSWTLEGFIEDRFSRQGVSGFGELGVTFSKVMGLSLYREWSY